MTVGEDEYNLLLMRLIDEQFTKPPFYGVCRMTVWLWRLMRLMELMAVYPKPRLSAPGPDHKVYPFRMSHSV